MIRAFFERIAVRILLLVARTKWGVTAVIMPVIVQRFGPFGAFRWLAKNLPKYERSIVDLGPIRANLVCATASLLNGCSYCTYAHGRAFELYYFEKYDRLFPLDEHEFISLIPLTDESVREKLEASLTEAGLADEVVVLRRLYSLKLENATPTSSVEDGYLMHALQMFDDLNFCAIDSQLALDDSHDRINKDTDLKARYAEARLAAGRREPTIDEFREAVGEATAPTGDT